MRRHEDCRPTRGREESLDYHREYVAVQMVAGLIENEEP
jgi:hypothetical protein